MMATDQAVLLTEETEITNHRARGTRMEFHLLGPMTVLSDGIDIPISAGNMRALLAALLLDANAPVSTERLVAAVWGQHPPRSAASSLHNHIQRLRRLLNDHDGSRILTARPGYLIRIEPGELDLDTFAGMCARGGQGVRDGQWAQASEDLAAALRLWRGTPLADVPGSESRQPQIQQLSEARLQALEGRIRADLGLGHHNEVIGELSSLIADYPLREGLHGQLMLALHRAGRQAEALQTYQELRRVLVDELAVEPSQPLRQLHQQILTADDALAIPASAKESVHVPVPAQLPADITDFTGRASLVDELCRSLLEQPARSGSAAPVTIHAITGAGGIGKTTFAVHVARRVIEAFPDGQLYVDLLGADSVSLDPGEVLIRLLRDLGTCDDALPVGEEACAARFRSLTSGRRMLLLLDNARDSAQVRPLLPGSGSCAVLVTGRGRLAGLPGAQPLNLEVLSAVDARTLFSNIVGRRVEAEPDAAADVVAYCAGLPLAVRIAAARLAARPAWKIGRMAERLADEHRRLDELHVDDVAVRASLQMSYANLTDSPAANGIHLRRAFGLLGLIPGPDITVAAAASLLGEPLPRTERILEALVDVNLLESPAGERYRFHGLVRVFAREHAAADVADADAADAVTRLVSWYTHATCSADAALSPNRRTRIEPAPVSGLGPVPIFGSMAEAARWCDDEHANLTAAAFLARSAGLDQLAWQLPLAIRRCVARTA